MLFVLFISSRKALWLRDGEKACNLLNGLCSYLEEEQIVWNAISARVKVRFVRLPTTVNISIDYLNLQSCKLRLLGLYLPGRLLTPEAHMRKILGTPTRQRLRLHFNFDIGLLAEGICWHCARRQTQRYASTAQHTGSGREWKSQESHDAINKAHMQRRQAREGSSTRSTTIRQVYASNTSAGPKSGIDTLQDPTRAKSSSLFRRIEYAPKEVWFTRWTSSPPELVRTYAAKPEPEVRKTRRKTSRLDRRKSAIWKPHQSIELILDAYMEQFEQKAEEIKNPVPRPDMASPKPKIHSFYRPTQTYRSYSTSSVGKMIITQILTGLTFPV